MNVKYSELKNLEIEFAMIDKLWQKDFDEACIAIMTKNKTAKPADIERHACEHGKLKKYLLERIFPFAGEGYWIVQDEKLDLKKGGTWEKYKKKIECKSKQLYKEVVDDCRMLYKTSVTGDETIIDMATGKINLALPMKCTYTGENQKKNKNARKILNFMKDIVCGGCEESWECMKYVIGCMTHRVRSDVIIFLQALGGVGKTFFANILKALFGVSMVKASEEVISGEDQFNSRLVGAVVACIEETTGSPNPLRFMRGLKDYATSEEFMARYMFVDGFSMKNILNIIVLSNHFRDLDCGDRRILVPSINNKYQNNTEYFSDLHDCLTEEAIQYLFNYFYEMDISKKVLAPETDAKKEYKIANMSSCVKFMIDEYMVKNRTENREMKMTDAYKKYVVWCDNNSIKTTAKSDYFSNTVRQYVPSVELDGKIKQKDHTNLYDFSTKTLIDRIITRSKVITPEYYQELMCEFGNGKQIPEHEHETHSQEMAKQIVALQLLLKDRDNTIEELTKKLEEKKKEPEVIEEPEEPKIKTKKLSKKMVDQLKDRLCFE
jgi:hypothetical protein